MDALHRELLTMIVAICKITDPVSDDYDVDAPLIGPQSPLGIDSLDAVEIVFNIRQVLASLRTLADFIARQPQ